MTYHYQEVPAELQEKVRDEAASIIKRYGYVPNPAHYALEAKPPVEWNKGSAAEFVLRDSFGENWQKQKINFAGDDTSDEDVMRILKGRGLTFKVSTDPDVQTFADYKIPTQSPRY